MGILLILTLIACASPLLTFAWLWQVKEWRVDRLQEHLRSSGWAKQLLGTTRPVVVAVTILATFFIKDAAMYGLGLLALSTIAQWALKRQRLPVWTAKAIILVSCCLVLDVLISQWSLFTIYYLLILVLLQPIVLLISWIIFLPADRLLKNRIMRRAKTLRESFTNLTVIGITGSVGKTTTKELLAHVLKEKEILCTPAYVNSDMGVAKWLLKELSSKNTDAEIIMIVEMGAYRKGEIALLCSLAAPDFGIITFIGSQHIALFGSQENLCNAKAELLDALPENGHAFLNADNEMCSELESHSSCNVTKVGTGGHADVEAFDIEEKSNGLCFRVDALDFCVPLHGTHNVTNVLLAIAAAEKLGLTKEEIRSALRSFAPPQHTFSVRKHGNITVLDDTHNASPASFKAAIAWAKSQPMEQKILLTPGLIELGSDEDYIHAALGTAASGVFNRVIFTGKNGAAAFTKGYGSEVEIMNKETQKAPKDSLLVCIGRVSDKTIKLLITNY